ncbi:MAG: universal stress protein [Desulfosarcinaceae bacterium]|nr:universal stress protein [Desulfosarcinaceae bacterium]
MSLKRIACCIDFSPNSDAAFDAAVELATRFDARLWLLHVLPPAINPMLTDTAWDVSQASTAALLPQLETRMVDTYGKRVPPGIDQEIVVLDGHVSTEILTFLNERPMDLVVMGSYGFTGMGLVVFGSVAKRVSHKAPCSVMVVRPTAAD